jgi:uncharacterized protein DUF4019
MHTKALVVVFFLAFCVLARATAEPIDNAKVAAAAWLELVDNLEYEKCWSEASSLLRSQVTRSDWEELLRSTRGPLGALVKRELESSEFLETLPELPDGEYVIFMFNSSFEDMESTAEILAVAKESDTSWRVIGYYFM